MKKIILIIQELIKLSLFFIISYIWLSFYLDDNVFSLILSLSISLTAETITFLISRKQTNKKHLKTTQINDAEKMFLSLVSDENAIKFFYNLFLTRHKFVYLKKDCLIIENQEKKKILIYPFLKINNLEIDDIFFIIKSYHADQIIILCNDFAPSCKQYKFEKEITLLNKYDTYTNIYKEYDFYPEIKKTSQTTPSFSFKTLVKTIFNKSKAKGYIISGFILLISSIYVPYNLYYKIIASILFVFAIICIITPSNNTKKELV